VIADSASLIASLAALDRAARTSQPVANHPISAVDLLHLTSFSHRPSYATIRPETGNMALLASR
jgi:hypothetical protein